MHAKIIQLMYSEDKKYSCSSLTIEIVFSLTYGKNAGAELLLRAPSLHNATVQEHALRSNAQPMTNPRYSQMQRCLGIRGLLHGILLAYFENNSRYCRYFCFVCQLFIYLLDDAHHYTCPHILFCSYLLLLSSKLPKLVFDLSQLDSFLLLLNWGHSPS